jgi:hypothetical protein
MHQINLNLPALRNNLKLLHATPPLGGVRARGRPPAASQRAVRHALTMRVRPGAQARPAPHRMLAFIPLPATHAAALLCAARTSVESREGATPTIP